MAKNKWSQAELSRRSGVPQPHISQYILGKTKPGLDVVEALADTFQVSVASLIGDLPPNIKPVPIALEERRLAAIAGILRLDGDSLETVFEVLEAQLDTISKKPQRRASGP
jgi:transcriptional regulator with XRE-family HTH domain